MPRTKTTVFSALDISQLAESDTDKRHYLIEELGNNVGARIQIPAGLTVLGRSDEADITFQDVGMSGRHCQLALRDDVLTVVDLESTNGTYVDGERISEERTLAPESQLQVGRFHSLKYEFRRAADVESLEQINEDIAKAASYVNAILPTEYADADMVIDWEFIPSAHLGGDAFGYHALDDDHFALYLIDVCGHGAGSAMHSVSVINVLRHQSIADTDFRSPSDVLNHLNSLFPMDEHGNLYFSMWYGVYQRSTKRLCYASAGHPPALLVNPENLSLQRLRTKGLAIGTFPDSDYQHQQVQISNTDILFIFSDGVYELQSTDGEQWVLKDFEQVLLSIGSKQEKFSRAAKQKVEAFSASSQWDDDFSMLAVQFR